MDNFLQALGTSTIAKPYLVSGLQCPLCERLCEISCSNGSNFRKLSSNCVIWFSANLDPSATSARMCKGSPAKGSIESQKPHEEHFPHNELISRRSYVSAS
jgi:hypothetical protein